MPLVGDDAMTATSVAAWETWRRLKKNNPAIRCESPSMVPLVQLILAVPRDSLEVAMEADKSG